MRLVRPGSRVLDVGCGEGALLELLVRENRVDGRGIEISPQGVSACLARGLAVMQGDADRDLDYFPAQAFDYVILSQTLQAVQRPRHVLGELLRIGDQAVVSLPNFGHWRVRLDLLLHGRMPVTGVPPRTVVGDAQHPSLHGAGFHRRLRRVGPAYRRLRGVGRRQARASGRRRARDRKLARRGRSLSA